MGNGKMIIKALREPIKEEVEDLFNDIFDNALFDDEESDDK